MTMNSGQAGLPASEEVIMAEGTMMTSDTAEADSGMAAPPMPTFHFALKSSEMVALSDHFGLSSFEGVLLSTIVHGLRLGVHLAETNDGTHTKPDYGISVANTTGLELTAFIAKAFQKHKTAGVGQLNRDKCFPLRKTGQSLDYVFEELSTLTGRRDVFQTLVWRVFGFGRMDRLRCLNFLHGDTELAITANNVFGAVSGEANSNDLLEQLSSLIKSWITDEKLFVPFYGNLLHPGVEVEGMVTKLYAISGMFLPPPTSPPTTTRSFKELLSIFSPIAGNHAIYNVPADGMVAWFVVADFWEYGLCEAPTAEDLVTYITRGSKTKVSAATKALNILAHAAGEEDNQAIKQDLQDVQAIEKRLKKVKAGLKAGAKFAEPDHARAAIKSTMEHMENLELTRASKNKRKNKRKTDVAEPGNLLDQQLEGSPAVQRRVTGKAAKATTELDQSGNMEDHE